MSNQVRLHLPDTTTRTRQVGDREEIWDPIRKKWLVLTPEEWVRQRFLSYLTEHRGVPPLLIRQEQALTLNNTARRADIVVYASSGLPKMVVECKAPGVRLTREVLEQAVRYNLVLQLPFLAITNGLQHFCYRFAPETNTFERLSEIPDFTFLTK